MRRKLTSLALGALFTFLLLELVLAASYRGFVFLQAYRNRASLDDGTGEVRILCVGESTTGVAGDEEGRMLVPGTAYPAQLETILNSRQSAVHFKVLNNGIMGGTSSSVLALLDQTLPVLRPHMIIAMMGIKDSATEGLPALARLPKIISSLRTVRMGFWLAKQVQLRHDDIDTEIESVDQIPASLERMEGPMQRYVMEFRAVEFPGGEDSQTMNELRIGAYYWYIGRLERSEAVLRRVIERDGVGYNLLARVLASADRRDEATALLMEAIRRDPQECMYREALAELQVEDGQYLLAQAGLRSALKGVDTCREPLIAEAYLKLGFAEALREGGDPQGAVDILGPMNRDLAKQRHAAVFPPFMLTWLVNLGYAHLDNGNYPQAEAALSKAAERVPGKHASMWLLSQVYRRTGRYEEEEAMRRKILASTERMADYLELVKLYKLTGQQDRIPELMDDAVARIPSLKASYQELYRVAELNGVQLVVMQYPSFSLEALHRYAPPKDGVLFIDNEHVFDADPDRYFYEPRFPHSFSHYTREGAEVLANHVADTVLSVTGGEGGALPAQGQ